MEALATRRYSDRDIGATLASGSFKTDGMVIVPCSIKSASAVAHCLTDTLMARAADVTLKEGRPLILVVRETPLHLGHLRLLTQLAEMGAVDPAAHAGLLQSPETDRRDRRSYPRAGARPAPAAAVAGAGVARRAPRAAAGPGRGARARLSRMTVVPDLSIVIPVYNEEESLPVLWSEIREALAPTGLDYEVIFVDDGSRDRSAEVVRGLPGRGQAGASGPAQGQCRRDCGHRRGIQDGARASMS